MKDVNTCAAKDCDKPRFLDYYVCAEHFWTLDLSISIDRSLVLSRQLGIEMSFLSCSSRKEVCSLRIVII